MKGAERFQPRAQSQYEERREGTNWQDLQKSRLWPRWSGKSGRWYEAGAAAEGNSMLAHSIFLRRIEWSWFAAGSAPGMLGGRQKP